MKTTIVYYSRHHGNTKRLVDAIAAENDVYLVDVTDDRIPDLTDYERVGFASGIYYGSFAKQLLSFAEDYLLSGKEVFFMATCGSERKSYFDAIRRITELKSCTELGHYLCLGYDTFGPFKLVGGIAKGHRTQEEIDGAAEFYRNLPDGGR